MIYSLSLSLSLSLFCLAVAWEMVDVLSLQLQRNNRQSALTVDPPMEKLDKNLYVHYIMEIKQPHAMTEPSAL